MWEKLFSLVRDLAFFAETTRQNRDEIQELQTQVHQLAVEMERLRGELGVSRERERQEREKFTLAIENVLLKLERQLPAPKGTKRKK